MKKMSVSDKAAFYELLSEAIENLKSKRCYYQTPKYNEDGEQIKDADGNTIYEEPTSDIDKKYLKAIEQLVEVLEEL